MLDHTTHTTNALRRKLVSIGWPAGMSLVFPAILALAFVTLLILKGRGRDAGILLFAQSAVLVVGVTRPRFASRFESFTASVSDAVADAIPLAALAWPLRLFGVRTGAAMIAAIGCVFLGAYARVKATSLGYRVPAGAFGAPERSAFLALGLISANITALEVCVWIIAAATFASSLAAAVAVWKQAE